MQFAQIFFGGGETHGTKQVRCSPTIQKLRQDCQVVQIVQEKLFWRSVFDQVFVRIRRIFTSVSDCFTPWNTFIGFHRCQRMMRLIPFAYNGIIQACMLQRGFHFFQVADTFGFSNRKQPMGRFPFSILVHFVKIQQHHGVRLEERLVKLLFIEINIQVKATLTAQYASYLYHPLTERCGQLGLLVLERNPQRLRLTTLANRRAMHRLLAHALQQTLKVTIPALARHPKSTLHNNLDTQPCLLTRLT
mmetsp:Transcript_2814/g.5367  ORF Transcript_2814/g.5367 Transcript_2814/m.5367 type:complete len:247 (-) Transcript_2814:5-745(-)